MRKCLPLVLLLSIWFARTEAQTISDGLMMPKNDFCTGFMYGIDKWTDYWEGELKRDNENVGSVSTQSITWVGAYGVTPKVNVIAMVPYVWTKATGGTMKGQKGLQDLTLAVKYNFFATQIGTGNFKTFGVLAFSTPLSDYTPDFLPLSIGMASKNISWRLTANYAFDQGIYINASGAYTWRSNVTLDRPSYYTGDQLYMTSEVKMPNVFDFTVNVGYHKNALQADLFYSQQNTLGGADIRRQDMPFVSNRMNFSKVGAMVMYYLPKPKNLAVRASGAFTVAGRNVGQSVAVMGGLLYTFHFAKTEQ
jgi:hypothetical protein